MKKFLGALALFVLIVGLGAYIYESGGAHPARILPRSDQRLIEVAGEALVVDLATTTAAREEGLSGRKSLGADEGMLFVFPQDGMYRFWMKEMNFPLDIIWISSDGHVVRIEPGLLPSTYPNSYGADSPARYVLEVNAGFSAAHGLKAGDRVGL